MGFAILWIVYFHSQIELPIPGIGFIKQIGYCGVDLFLFISGMGIYCSLHNNKDLLPFYARRLSRVMVPYVPAFLFWFIGRVITEIRLGEVTNYFEVVKAFFGNLVMLGWLNGIPYTFVWYVQMLMWFYLVSPIIYEVLLKCEKSKKGYLWFALLLISTQFVFMDFYQTLMAVSRIFIYVLGMVFAHFYFEKKNTNLFFSIPLMFIGIILAYLSLHIWKDYLWTFGLWWYPFLLVAPGMIFLLALIGERMCKNKIMEKLVTGVSYLGGCSLEIFLIQVIFFNLFTDYYMVDTNLKWFVFSILSIIFGVFYSIALKWIRGKYRGTIS